MDDDSGESTELMEEVPLKELFSGIKDERVVLVAERLEGGPVSSRVSAFPEVFSLAKGGPK